MSTKYTFSIFNDFPNSIVDTSRLSSEVVASDIIIVLDYINTYSDDCDIWFKADLTGSDQTTLSGIVAAHSGEPPDVILPPTMSDGRPLVRADTRPLDTQTFFTSAGDTASGIGNGTTLRWDFSNDDDIVELGYDVTPEGYKTKAINLQFLDPIYLKDGSLYFFDVPWGAYCDMHIIVPAGNYYPNDHGSIPAAALGQPGTQMYSYAAQDTIYVTYVNKHPMYGSCPMGDELNAEGAAVDAVPVGWYITGHITTVSGDNTSKGYASFECYRKRTVILEGDTP
jgi:hypothetical protein